MQPDVRTTAFVRGNDHYRSVGILAFVLLMSLVVDSFNKLNNKSINVNLVKCSTSILQPCSNYQGFGNEEMKQDPCSHAACIPEDCFFFQVAQFILTTHVCSDHSYPHYPGEETEPSSR